MRIAAALVQESQASIPKAMEDWGQIKAVYRFASNEHVSHEGILSGHFRATAARCGEVARVLVVQDTTHVSFGGRKDSDLGPVDTSGDTRGYLAHSALAVDGTNRRPLGLLAQRVWARSAARKRADETTRERKRRRRESDKWPLASVGVHEQLEELGAQRPQVVEIFDREGDIFEAIEMLDELGHGFVIRAGHDRLLETDDAEREYLAEAAALAPLRGHLKLAIPARPGRSARDALLELRSTDVALAPPKNRARQGAPLELSLVWAVEKEPPVGEKPVCWLLLTREPCATAAEAAHVVGDYACRWLIEEFHMALKTGCSLEERQLQTFARLTNLLAIFSPIAVQMLVLRHLERTLPTQPATLVLAPLQLRALRILRPELPAVPSVRDALRAIARIGGFIGRKSDGEPGWRTLWLGFRDLLAAERVLLGAEKTG